MDKETLPWRFYKIKWSGTLLEKSYGLVLWMYTFTYCSGLYKLCKLVHAICIQYNFLLTHTWTFLILLKCRTLLKVPWLGKACSLHTMARVVIKPGLGCWNKTQLSYRDKQLPFYLLNNCGSGVIKMGTIERKMFMGGNQFQEGG